MLQKYIGGNFDKHITLFGRTQGIFGIEGTKDSQYGETGKET